jgi:membrane-associated phospholipid phosphatase
LNLKGFIISFLLVTGTVLLCVRWVDSAVALILNKSMPNVLAARTAGVPDLLLPVTLVISAASWSGYAWLTWRKSKSPLRSIFATIGLASLLSFAAKDVLQILFGRLNPRQWLAGADQAQFHILGANGVPGAFPSGHMSVFTPVFIALHRIFPSLRNWWFLFWAALALTLVVGNYHFVSDVIAGSYLGFLVDFVSLYLALRIVRSADRMDGLH